MSRPWLRHYDPGVPQTLEPYPDKTLLDIFAATVRERPGHTALLFKGTRITCGKLDALATRLAPFKLPAQLEIHAELPKSLVGKVLRRVLVEEQRLSDARAEPA
jgi:acyl-CoA synthetase (AMP-forming)/AMP-acid ligase II